MFSFFRKAKVWQCDLSKGIAQAEKSAREFSADKKILAKNLSILAKESFTANPYESIAFMRESDSLAPSDSKKKWIGFRLFDKGLHEEAYQILSLLNETLFKSESEIKKLKIVKAKHICNEQDEALSIKKIEVISVSNGSNVNWVENIIDQFEQTSSQNYYSDLPLNMGLISPETFTDIDDNIIRINRLSPKYIENIENNNLAESLNIDVLVFVASLSGKYKDWSDSNLLDKKDTERIIKCINLFKKKNIVTVFYAIEDNSNFGLFIDIANQCQYIYSPIKNYALSENKTNNGYVSAANEICIDYPLFGIDLTKYNPSNFYYHNKSRDIIYSCSNIYDYFARESLFSDYIDVFNEFGRRLYVLDNISYLPDRSDAKKNSINRKIELLNKAFDYALVDFNNSSLSNYASYIKMKLQGNILLAYPSDNLINNSDFFVIPNAHELKNLLSTTSDEQLYEYQICSIRNAVRQYSSYEAMVKFATQIGLASVLKERLFQNLYEKTDGCKLLDKEILFNNFRRSILVIVSNISEEIKINFERQSYGNKTLICINELTPELLKQYDFVTWFDENSYYGVYYLEDMINAFKFNKCSYVTKDSYFDGEDLIPGYEYHTVDHLNSKYRTVFNLHEFDHSLFLENLCKDSFRDLREGVLIMDNGYSVDHLNYIKDFYRRKEKELNCINADTYEQHCYDISVIIPIFNNGNYLLNRCLPSLLKCSNFNKLEIILIDDNSTDRITLDAEQYLGERYSNIKLHYLKNGPSGSASTARNFGVGLATANYIVFLDPDDEVINDGYSKLYECIVQDKCDIVVGNFLTIRHGVVNTNTYTMVNECLGKSIFEQGLSKYLSKLNFPTIRLHSMLIKRDYLHNFVYKQVDGAIGEDSLFAWQLLCGKCVVEFVNENIQQYNSDIPLSVTNVIDLKFFEKLAKIQNYKIDWLKDKELLDDYVNKKFLAYYHNLVLNKLYILFANKKSSEYIDKSLFYVASMYELYRPYITDVSESNKLYWNFSEDLYSKFIDGNYKECHNLLNDEFNLEHRTDNHYVVSDKNHHKEILLSISLIINAYVGAEELQEMFSALTNAMLCDNSCSSSEEVEILVFVKSQSIKTEKLLRDNLRIIDQNFKNVTVKFFGLINANNQFIQNIALSEAKGKFITFADENVIYIEGSISKLIKQLNDLDTSKDILVYPYNDLSRYSTVDKEWTNKGIPNKLSMLGASKELHKVTIDELCTDCSDYLFNKIYSLDFIRKNNVSFPIFGIYYSDKCFNNQLFFCSDNVYVSSSVLLSYKLSKFDNQNKYALKSDSLGFENFIKFYLFWQKFAQSKFNKNNNLDLLTNLFKKELNCYFYNSVFNKKILLDSIIEQCTDSLNYSSSISLINNDKHPLISIVMPVFNAYSFFESTIQSVLNQTYENLEILCVDDCSTDKTLQLLNYYKNRDSRIKIIVNDQNRGAGYCRNLGIEKMTGEYCLFLDSDDWFKPEFVEKMYQKISNDQSDICFCNYTTVYCNGCEGKTTNFAENVTENPFKPEDYADCLFQINHAVPWNKIFRTDFIRQNKLKYELLSSSNDLTFTLISFAISKSISFLKGSFINYCIMDGRYTTRRLNERHIDNVLKAYDELFFMLKDKGLHNKYFDTYYLAFNNSLKYRVSIGSSLSSSYESKFSNNIRYNNLKILKNFNVNLVDVFVSKKNLLSVIITGKIDSSKKLTNIKNSFKNIGNNKIKFVQLAKSDEQNLTKFISENIDSDLCLFVSESSLNDIYDIQTLIMNVMKVKQDYLYCSFNDNLEIADVISNYEENEVASKSTIYSKIFTTKFILEYLSKIVTSKDLINSSNNLFRLRKMLSLC